MATQAELMATARNIARSRVKDEMRRNGLGISLVSQMEIYRAASLLMEFCGDEFLAEAKAQLNRASPPTALLG